MQEILVIGGGITGLTAALDLASLGYPVRLVEKKDTAGGHSANYGCMAVDRCRQCGACLVNDALKKVMEEPLITLSLSTEVKHIAHSEQGLLITLGASHGDEQTLFPAAILCSGFAPFNPRLKKHFGFGRIPNMISGYEMKANLRKEGVLLRPSDKKPPRRVAFVQCVGSRDASLGNRYCSRVCCAYAIMAAHLLKHEHPDMEITFFYMDVQSFGKNFHEIFPRIQNEITMVREIPGEYYTMDRDRVGVLVPHEQGMKEEAFDLLVLSVGMTPQPEYAAWAEEWGLTLDEDGFLHREGGEGIFIAGSATGPMDIKECVADAHRAVREIIRYLGATA